MSQTKVQLIAPIGVVTASTLETTGVLTATTFVGDIAGTVTGITSTTDNLNLGIITATSFAGDFTGIGSGLTGTPNVVAGVVTATKFVGNSPGTVSGIADGTNINAGIITATSFVGNLTGNAAGLSTTTGHANLGIVTATSFHGDGSNLTGIAATNWITNNVTANSSTTTVNLSLGNVVKFTQSANTTVSFANTGTSNIVSFIRVKDSNSTTRTLTWPDSIKWNGGSTPNIVQNNPTGEEFDLITLLTRDEGLTWYGWLTSSNSRTDNNLFGWGSNDKGQLGYNNRTNYSSPIQVSGTSWRSTAIGYTNEAVGTDKHALASKSDGTLWSWGYGYHGTLGLNQGSAPGPWYSSPVQIPGTTWGTHQVIGPKQSSSLGSDGTLWTWGNNDAGQLGLNSPNNDHRSSPVQVPGTTWSWIEFGERNALALKTNGEMWSWGYNDRGSLGQNNRTRYSSPVQIPGTSWANCSCGTYHAMATRTDGTLWFWGDDSYGQHGAATPDVRKSSPVQLPGTTWASCKAGSHMSMATRTDGTLWMWGLNSYGQQCGNGQVNQARSSPVQIPGTSWSTTQGQIWVGRYSALAMRTDGTLWAMGYGGYGNFGQNNTTSYSSPVQIPGTWSSFGGQGTFNFGVQLLG